MKPFIILNKSIFYFSLSPPKIFLYILLSGCQENWRETLRKWHHTFSQFPSHRMTSGVTPSVSSSHFSILHTKPKITHCSSPSLVLFSTSSTPSNLKFRGISHFRSNGSPRFVARCSSGTLNPSPHVFLFSNLLLFIGEFYYGFDFYCFKFVVDSEY